MSVLLNIFFQDDHDWTFVGTMHWARQTYYLTQDNFLYLLSESLEKSDAFVPFVLSVYVL